MARLLLTIAAVLWLAKPTLGIVESVDFQATLNSEKDELAVTQCNRLPQETPIRTVNKLEDCGVSITREQATGSDSYLRIYDSAQSPYGWSSITFNRRHPLPVWGFDARIGPSISTSISLIPFQGETSISTSISLVERMNPAIRPDDGPAILSLGVHSVGLDNFETASVKVFDHDTNELLLTWDLDDKPLRPNRGFWFRQEFDFDDRVGNAIRYELEVDGSSVGERAYFAAVANLGVPEPGGLVMVSSGLVGLGMLRRKREMVADE